MGMVLGEGKKVQSGWAWLSMPDHGQEDTWAGIAGLAQ